LTYITPRIIGTTGGGEGSAVCAACGLTSAIAMALPAEGIETAFRNSLSEVSAMLRAEHDTNFMVYNLSEKDYNVAKLNNQVLDFGWPDHQAPPLTLLFVITTAIHAWQRSGPENVCIVHCKGGKGRTGTVI